MGQHPAEMQPQQANLLQPVSLRTRNLVERFFNKIKQCRRVATRYDKLAANYLAFVQLASIRLWLRVNDSAPFGNSAANRFSPIREKFTTRLPGAELRAAHFSSVNRAIIAAPSVPAR